MKIDRFILIAIASIHILLDNTLKIYINYTITPSI